MGTHLDEKTTTKTFTNNAQTHLKNAVDRELEAQKIISGLYQRLRQTNEMLSAYRKLDDEIAADEGDYDFIFQRITGMMRCVESLLRMRAWCLPRMYTVMDAYTWTYPNSYTSIQHEHTHTHTHTHVYIYIYAPICMCSYPAACTHIVAAEQVALLLIDHASQTLKLCKLVVDKRSPSYGALKSRRLQSIRQKMKNNGGQASKGGKDNEETGEMSFSFALQQGFSVHTELENKSMQQLNSENELFLRQGFLHTVVQKGTSVNLTNSEINRMRAVDFTFGKISSGSESDDSDDSDDDDELKEKAGENDPDGFLLNGIDLANIIVAPIRVKHHKHYFYDNTYTANTGDGGGKDSAHQHDRTIGTATAEKKAGANADTNEQSRSNDPHSSSKDGHRELIRQEGAVDEPSMSRIRKARTATTYTRFSAGYSVSEGSYRSTLSSHGITTATSTLGTLRKIEERQGDLGRKRSSTVKGKGKGGRIDDADAGGTQHSRLSEREHAHKGYMYGMYGLLVVMNKLNATDASAHFESARGVRYSQRAASFTNVDANHLQTLADMAGGLIDRANLSNEHVAYTQLMSLMVSMQ